MTPAEVRHSTVVVTPTVPARAQARQVTFDQWRNLGWEPVAVEQRPPTDGAPTYSHARHRANAHAALKAGLRTGADVIVFAEDDLDLDPRIPDMLPACVGPQPCSLWHRPKFQPPGIYRPGQVTVVPAQQQTAWFSSLCVVFTRDQARLMLTTDLGRDSFDLDLRALGVRITVPSLVEHRRLRRLASRGGHIVSDTYEGPTTDPVPGGLLDAG